jgi:hypothetical protein
MRGGFDPLVVFCAKRAHTQAPGEHRRALSKSRQNAGHAFFATSFTTGFAMSFCQDGFAV